jgi:FixJ family two-component response regulator
MADEERQATEAEVEAALKDLNPRDRELAQSVLADYPSLPVEEVIEILREFGGL